MQTSLHKAHSIGSPAGSLRVALVYDESLDGHGGIPQYLSMLVRGLSRRGHHVELLVADSETRVLDGAPVRSLARSLPVRFNGSSGTMPFIGRRQAISRCLRDGRFDVVHVQLPASPLLASRVIRQLGERTALVGTFHTYSELLVPRLGTWCLGAATARTRRRFDTIVCVSEAAGAHAERCFGLRGAQVVPNMVDVAAMRRLATAGIPPAGRGPRLAFVGALVRRKGIRTLIAAMPEICDAHPDAVLTVAGEGYLRPQLETLARRQRLSGNITFAGRVSEAQKARLLGGADVACFPSLYGESFGIVLLEAIAAGAGAVVAARNRGYAEVLRETPDALFPPGNSRELARVVGRMLTHPAVRASVRGRQEVIARAHDVDSVCDQILRVYGCALRRSRATAHLTSASRRPESNATRGG